MKRVCVPLGRLITPTDKRRYDNAEDASVTGLSKWVMRAACEKDDHQKCGVRSLSCTVNPNLKKGSKLERSGTDLDMTRFFESAGSVIICCSFGDVILKGQS